MRYSVPSAVYIEAVDTTTTVATSHTLRRGITICTMAVASHIRSIAMVEDVITTSHIMDDLVAVVIVEMITTDEVVTMAQVADSGTHRQK